MYITSHDKTVALDADTARNLKTMIVYPPGVDEGRLLRHRQPWGRALQRRVLPHHLDGRVGQH